MRSSLLVELLVFKAFAQKLRSKACELSITGPNNPIATGVGALLVEIQWSETE